MAQGCWILLLTDGCILAGGLQRQGYAGDTEMQARLPRRLHQEVAADEELVPGVQSRRRLGRHQRSEQLFCAPPRSIHFFRLRSNYICRSILLIPASRVNKCRVLVILVITWVTLAQILLLHCKQSSGEGN
jgi:hypothetical protein